MKNYIIYIVLFFLISNCNNLEVKDNKSKALISQDTVVLKSKNTDIIPKINFSEKFNRIIPSGYEIYDLDSGSLNLDLITDYVIIVNDINEKLYFDRDFKRDSLKSRVAMLVIGLPKD